MFAAFLPDNPFPPVIDLNVCWATGTLMSIFKYELPATPIA
jgi:hypothetical protein